jgi:hypothetical protein
MVMAVAGQCKIKWSVEYSARIEEIIGCVFGRRPVEIIDIDMIVNALEIYFIIVYTLLIDLFDLCRQIFGVRYHNKVIKFIGTDFLSELFELELKILT